MTQVIPNGSHLSIKVFKVLSHQCIPPPLLLRPFTLPDNIRRLCVAVCKSDLENIPSSHFSILLKRGGIHMSSSSDWDPFIYCFIDVITLRSRLYPNRTTPRKV